MVRVLVQLLYPIIIVNNPLAGDNSPQSPEPANNVQLLTPPELRSAKPATTTTRAGDSTASNHLCRRLVFGTSRALQDWSDHPWSTQNMRVCGGRELCFLETRRSSSSMPPKVSHPSTSAWTPARHLLTMHFTQSSYLRPSGARSRQWTQTKKDFTSSRKLFRASSSFLKITSWHSSHFRSLIFFPRSPG